jgi:hypothetical protein
VGSLKGPPVVPLQAARASKPSGVKLPNKLFFRIQPSFDHDLKVIRYWKITIMEIVDLLTPALVLLLKIKKTCKAARSK